LSLPDGVFLLGRPSIGSKLMIRDCYKPLYEMVRDSSDFTRWVLVGTPVFGKTLFTAYVMWELALANGTQ